MLKKLTAFDKLNHFFVVNPWGQAGNSLNPLQSGQKCILDGLVRTFETDAVQARLRKTLADVIKADETFYRRALSHPTRFVTEDSCDIAFVTTFNDHPETTLKDIREIINRANEYA